MYLCFGFVVLVRTSPPGLLDKPVCGLDVHSVHSHFLSSPLSYELITMAFLSAVLHYVSQEDSWRRGRILFEYTFSFLEGTSTVLS